MQVNFPKNPIPALGSWPSGFVTSGFASDLKYTHSSPSVVKLILPAPPSCQKQAWQAICSAPVYKFYNDFCQTNNLKIYWTDLHQIFKIGRTMAVDDQHEISFSIPQYTLPWQPIFVGMIHRTSVVRGCRAVCRRLVVRLGGLTSGSAVNLVS